VKWPSVTNVHKYPLRRSHPNRCVARRRSHHSHRSAVYNTHSTNARQKKAAAPQLIFLIRVGAFPPKQTRQQHRHDLRFISINSHMERRVSAVPTDKCTRTHTHAHAHAAAHTNGGGNRFIANGVLDGIARIADGAASSILGDLRLASCNAVQRSPAVQHVLVDRSEPSAMAREGGMYAGTNAKKTHGKCNKHFAQCSSQKLANAHTMPQPDEGVHGARLCCVHVGHRVDEHQADACPSGVYARSEAFPRLGAPLARGEKF
jgi:hypothetical protein